MLLMKSKFYPLPPASVLHTALQTYSCLQQFALTHYHRSRRMVCLIQFISSTKSHIRKDSFYLEHYICPQLGVEMIYCLQTGLVGLLLDTSSLFNVKWP